MKSKRQYTIALCLLLFAVVVLYFLPSVASAQRQFTGGIIPENCRTGCACNLCDLYQLAINVIDFLLYGISLPIAAGMFAWGGLKMLTSAGNTTAITEGKKILTNAVIGILLAFIGWVLINALLGTLGFGIDAWSGTRWYERPSCAPSSGQCSVDDIMIPPPPPGTPPPPPGTPPPPPQARESCNDPAALALQYNVPYPAQNSPTLNALISCIHGRVSGGLGSEFTFGNDHPLCNYTRGDRICGECDHSVGSCHYGGLSSSNGAHAVDFGNEARGDEIIAAALACGSGSARCENENSDTVPCTGSDANHVHVNTSQCGN